MQPEVSLLLIPPPLTSVTTPSLPEQIELPRDRMWRRDEGLRVEALLIPNGSSETWDLKYADRCPSRKFFVAIAPLLQLPEPRIRFFCSCVDLLGVFN